MMADVITGLRRAGIQASFEYPSCVVVPCGDGRVWTFGTANENWTGDLLTAGGEHVRSVDLGIPSGAEDMAAVTRAIEKVVAAPS